MLPDTQVTADGRFLEFNVGDWSMLSADSCWSAFWYGWSDPA